MSMIGLVHAIVLVPSIFIEQLPKTPLATRSSEHEGGIDPVLDEKKSIQDHGAAFVEIDVIGVDPGTLVPIGIEPIYLERFGAPCAFGRRPNLACTNLGVSRQPNIPQKSSHVRVLD